MRRATAWRRATQETATPAFGTSGDGRGRGDGNGSHLTLINPEDDFHSFVLPGSVVALPGGQRVDATYVARRVGIHAFHCNVASHLPTMWGQLVVLPAGAMAGVGLTPTPGDSPLP